MSTRATGVYVKGSRTRNVTTAGAAVQAEWDGFRPAAEQDATQVAYADFQAQAKALGIPANQKAGVLAEAIANHEPSDASEPQSALGQAPETVDSDEKESTPEELGDEPFDPQS